MREQRENKVNKNVCEVIKEHVPHEVWCRECHSLGGHAREREREGKIER